MKTCIRKIRLTEHEFFLFNRTRCCRLVVYVLIAGTDSSLDDALHCLHMRRVTMFCSYCSKTSMLQQTVLQTWTFHLIIHTEHYSEDYVKYQKLNVLNYRTSNKNLRHIASPALILLHESHSV